MIINRIISQVRRIIFSGWLTLQLLALRITRPNIWKALIDVRQKKITYLGNKELLSLVRNTTRIINNKIDGQIIEAGCALGGSAITIAVSKLPETQFSIFDTFEMIPPPTDNDGEDAHVRYKTIISHKSEGIDSSQYYGYVENLYDRVYDTFIEFNLNPENNNIYLVKGLFENTMKITSPVALAHLDCDWYDSVMVCLHQIVPNLSIGGLLIVDDYFHWSGCKKAVDEFFSGDRLNDYRFKNSGHLLISRIR